MPPDVRLHDASVDRNSMPVGGASLARSQPLD